MPVREGSAPDRSLARAVLAAAILIGLSLGAIDVIGAKLDMENRDPDDRIVLAQAPELVRYMPDIRTRGYVSPTLTPTPTSTITDTPPPIGTLPAISSVEERLARSLNRSPLSRSDHPRSVAASPAGISGFGDSVVALQNSIGALNSLDVMITQRARNRIDFNFDLMARGAHTVSLAAREGTPAGFWHGVLRPSAAADAVVRSTWPLTATSAYRALTPAKNFFLPLAVRGLDRHFFTYYLQNADDDLERNIVTFQVFDAETGGIEYEWEDWLEPGQVIDVDSIESTTGPSLIPPNSRDGAWIGGLRIRSEGNVVLLAYGNEAQDGGVAAYSAQPVSRASETVHLPLIRANVFGDSLIAIGNPGAEPIEARLVYLGSADSPSGAGETFEHEFTVHPRSSRFVDFGDRGWGTIASSLLPRGSRAHSGFVGSARIEADGDVVATVLETALYMTATRATAAYDGFTPDDLGLGFAVPYLIHVPDGVSTRFILLNPGAAAVSVTTQWDLDHPAPDMPPAETVEVPAGTMRMITTKGAREFTGRARVSASGPIAMLVYETPFDTAADFGPAGDLGYDTAAYAAPRLIEPASIEPSPPPPTMPSPTATPTTWPPDAGAKWTIHMPQVMKAHVVIGR